MKSTTNGRLSYVLLHIKAHSNSHLKKWMYMNKFVHILEMNMFFPQSITARHEIWTLARPEALIVNGAQNAPLFGIVQDSLLGAFLMSMNSTKIPRELAMNILALNDEYIKKTEKSIYSGNELFTTIIPEVNMSKATNTFTKDSDDAGDYEDGLYSKDLYEKIKKEKATENYKHDSIIKVINGNILSGAIDKKAGLGATNEGSFAHLIWLDFGQDYAGRFLSLVQKYTNKFLLNRGFSVGLGDITPSLVSKTEMNNIIIKSLEKMHDLLKRIDKGLLIVPQDTTVEEYLEKKATEYFAPLSGKVGVLALAHLNSRTNALKAMIVSGSKGKELNAGQMMGCVGHNTINQSRIKMTFGGRTLPFYYRGEQSPESRGFIQHSFIDGLNPMEFFFHSMSGREGVIDTAIKTADSGYISRKLMKALEDFSVDYYNKVVNSGGQIIQFLYGDDGIDPVYVERQKFKTMLLSLKEIDEKYDVKKSTKKSKEQLQQIKDDRDFLISIRHVYENSNMGQVFLPVNIERIILNTENSKNSKTENSKNPKTENSKKSIEKDSELSYDEAIEKIENLINELPSIFRNRLNPNIRIGNNIKYASKLLGIMIRSNLSARQVVDEYKFTRISFDSIIAQIKMKYLQAIAQPGEMVGVITAQGIGEPSTQLTLNTLNFACKNHVNG
jgi:DNA-directed RNA polymerase II subunit RPB1